LPLHEEKAVMPTEEKRILTEEEKLSLLEKHPECYICLEPLAGYERSEIQFDHIYSYGDGYPQDLSNFAPVHASTKEHKLNCHSAKGRKSPADYREELRIRNKLRDVKDLSSLCPEAIPSTYQISQDRHSIMFNGVSLPLYNQQIGTKDNLYFFCELETKYIENDDQIQLRPLEPKILPLIFNLKHSVQLLPSLARLDRETKKVKLFDGQHKAVAQIIGNNRNRIQCIVFVDPDINNLRVTVYEAHTDFVQQRYKKSHIDAKLADIYAQKIEAFRKKVGNPDAPYSEADILAGESAASVRSFLISSIIKELKTETDFVSQFAAESRIDQKLYPILWQSIERMVSTLCRVKPVEDLSESENNFRSDEIENLGFLVEQIEEFAIRGKWDPSNASSELHKLSRTYFYRAAFNNWIGTLEEALRHVIEQMRGAKLYEAVCYQPTFAPNVRKRYSDIVKHLFTHPLWVQPPIQQEIAKTNQDAVVTKVFAREGLDYMYLIRL
jgi:hypothetical protein